MSRELETTKASIAATIEWLKGGCMVQDAILELELTLANLQAAKPVDALESLPVVAWRWYTHNDEIASNWTYAESPCPLCPPPDYRIEQQPLTDHAQATAEIAKRDAEFAQAGLQIAALRAQLDSAEKELRTCKSNLFELRNLLDERPAINQGLFEAYTEWTGKVYSLDVLDAMDNTDDQPKP